MEYQKIMNSLDDTTNQPSKFRARIWVELNNESQGAYNNDDNNNNDNNNIKFKASMVRSSLCDYSDAHILVSETIVVKNPAASCATVNDANKKVIFKNYYPFTSCITEMNNTQVDYAENIDIVMTMYNLIEYSIVYSKTSGSL